MRVRLAEVLALGVGLAGTVGLALYLEVDRAQGQVVWVAATPSGSQLDLQLQPRDEYDYQAKPTWLVLDLDADDLLTASRYTHTADPTSPSVRVRWSSTGPTSFPTQPTLDPALTGQVRWAQYRVTPAGEAYLVGVTDEHRAWLGRGDATW